MKRLLIAGLLISMTGVLWAASDIWRSSYTATADTTQNLCVNKHGFLHSIIVSSASNTSGGQIAIYASSATVNSTITIVDTQSRGQYFFDTVAVATNTAGDYDNTGLTYSKVGTACVTIFYNCY